jgi:hypothetical protein
MNAAVGGVFLSLTIRDATTLIENMASNQSWNEERTQTHKKGGGMHKMASNQSWNEERTQTCKKGGGMHQLKEVDMLSAKMDLLMKKLEDRASEKKEIMYNHDSRMTCEVCGDTRHSGSN